ncbi:MAG: hypothetical protein AB2L24_12470 [Mangrovibacterium sp.]
MSYRDFLVQFINSLSGMESDCRILQIGPGGDTYEISANPDSAVREQNDRTQQSTKGGFHCSTCLFQVECQKGREIVNHQCPYEKCLFDRILLHAKTDLKSKDLFDEAIRMLKGNGQIIVLINNGKNVQDQTLRDFCFQADEIIGQFSAHSLAIRSAASFRLASSVAMCLTASKYQEIMQ